MLRKIIAGTAALAAVSAFTLLAPQQPAGADDTRTRPIQTATITPKVKLLKTENFQVACLTMDRGGEYTVETVDAVFRYRIGRRWYTAWQATDGFQFVVVPVPQNQPFGCVPLKARVKIPETWTKER